MKPKYVMLISLAVGLLAFWLTATYLRNERARIAGQIQMQWVVAAYKDLPAGSTIEASDLGQVYVSKSGIRGRAVLKEEVNEIIGRKLQYNIPRGSAIMWSDVGVEFRGESGLAEVVTPGLRAISISVDAVSSVSGLVKPNDHVDILGTFTFPSKNQTSPGQPAEESVTVTVLQDVTVLATGQTMGKRADDSSAKASARSGRGYGSVTLEVTPREAELLAFLQSVKGRVTLSLRNPADVSYVTDLPDVNFDHLHNKIPELNLIRQRDIRHKKPSDIVR